MFDDMNVLFVCGIYSESQVDFFMKHSKRGFQFADQTFQGACISGLKKSGLNFTVLSKPFLSTFPFGFKRPFVKSDDLIYQGEKVGKSLGFLNMMFVGGKVDYKSEISFWAESSDDNKVALIYSLTPGMVRIGKWIKEMYPEIHVCFIIPDLPIFTNANKVYKLLGLKKRDVNFVMSAVTMFDSYVVLTESIAEALHVNRKPHIVIEGIFNPGKEIVVPKNEKKVFLYTGGLALEYGVGDLVLAFANMKEENIELWLCGNGNAEEMIKEISTKDPRIKFFGKVEHDKVLEMQHEASFLVNPRHSTEDFIKYSFPSKTMEYMASGTPVIMCRLGCLPEEYKKYLLFFEDESIEGFSSTMSRVLTMDPIALNELSNGAKYFILKNKTPDEQIGKVIRFLQNITK